MSRSLAPASIWTDEIGDRISIVRRHTGILQGHAPKQRDYLDPSDSSLIRLGNLIVAGWTLEYSDPEVACYVPNGGTHEQAR